MNSDPNPVKNDYTTQLLTLKALFEATGGLHEGLVQQLKLWPYAVDPSLENSVCKVDQKNLKVIYEWEGPSQKLDKDYKYRLKELEKGIKLIIGADYDLQILLNGVPIFPLTPNGKRRHTRKSRANSSRNNRKRASNRKAKSNRRRK